MHDLILDFARRKLGEKLRLAQCLFVEALRGQCEDGDWGKFQGNKDYYFKYLTYHLHFSEQLDKLSRLLFNFAWLHKKVNQLDLPSLISDFRFLDSPSKEVKLLKSSLLLSSGAIEKNANSIGPQLLGIIVLFFYILFKLFLFARLLRSFFSPSFLSLHACIPFLFVTHLTPPYPTSLILHNVIVYPMY